jgi:hypothetical protein
MVLGYAMATNGSGQPDFNNSDLMNYVVRMVIPMRREFARSLDVSHFLHDFTYAQEIIGQAKVSKDARLREYATYLESKMFGPRNAATPPPGAHSQVYEPTAAAPLAEMVVPPTAAKPPVAPAAPATPAAPTSAELSEAEMRARMMSKYKSGLR